MEVCSVTRNMAGMGWEGASDPRHQRGSQGGGEPREGPAAAAAGGQRGLLDEDAQLDAVPRLHAVDEPRRLLGERWDGHREYTAGGPRLKETRSRHNKCGQVGIRPGGRRILRPPLELGFEVKSSSPFPAMLAIFQSGRVRGDFRKKRVTYDTPKVESPPNPHITQSGGGGLELLKRNFISSHCA